MFGAVEAPTLPACPRGGAFCWGWPLLTMRRCYLDAGIGRPAAAVRCLCAVYEARGFPLATRTPPTSHTDA